MAEFLNSDPFQWFLWAAVVACGIFAAVSSLIAAYHFGQLNILQRNLAEAQQEMDRLRLDREFQNQPDGDLKQRYLALVAENRNR